MLGWVVVGLGVWQLKQGEMGQGWERKESTGRAKGMEGNEENEKIQSSQEEIEKRR